ncbi:hypothetical protein [Lederbergia citrea]|uniref:Uncharacterized protein n=1 Tax=Lederbergia citrea TaxID=2833581 RepID=A0A942UL63_9BACI|nr:hypothetical protein [Lederbergia citrea]MBS4176047.1 hypothetical protein [Lederbergia citrea]MBS4202609.1 hypothetical protein [Lederbergia citrea]MBS4222725.1 hypothetical protein [Lederbergia citrea]
MNNRFLLCLLLCAAMLYFAVPKLSPLASGPKGIFAISWLVFAFIVAAGNLSALLYSPKKNRNIKRTTHDTKRMRAR